ncbi:MAG: hypothetical protein ACRBHB_17365 [Arenicella sp.]
MKNRNMKDIIYLSLAIGSGLLLVPDAWACFNSNGGAVSCSSPACDPAKSAAGGGQCLTSPSSTPAPTAIPEPTPVLPAPSATPSSVTGSSGDNFALKNKTPYFLENSDWYRDPISELFEGRKYLFRDSQLPENLLWMEEFFGPEPSGPRLAEMFNQRFEDDFRLMQLQEKENSWYEWMNGMRERLNEIEEKVSLSLTENDRFVTDNSWSDTVKRNAYYDPEYRKLTQSLYDNKNEKPLSASDQKQKDALVQKINNRDKPLRTNMWGDPIEVNRDEYLSQEEIKNYERYKRQRLIEIESNSSIPHSVISETQGVIKLN